jgi:hypothetical protein
METSMIESEVQKIEEERRERMEVNGREDKRREGKGREGKGREGKGREGKGRDGKGREGKSREKRRREQKRREARRGEERTEKKDQKRLLSGIDDGIFGEDRQEGVRECVRDAISWRLFGWNCKQKGLLDALGLR